MSVTLLQNRNPDHITDFRPGPVSSVGDCNIQVKLKHSHPDMPMRYEHADSDLKYIGTMTQDGTKGNFTSGGGPATVIKNGWRNTGFSQKIKIGREWQDVRPTDRYMDSIMTQTPQYSWKTIIKNNEKAKSVSSAFLPLPGPYISKPGDIPRGGAIPSEIVMGEDTSFKTIQQQKLFADTFSKDPLTGNPISRTDFLSPSYYQNLLGNGGNTSIYNPIFGPVSQQGQVVPNGQSIVQPSQGTKI